jgi:PKD repeat protein
MKPEVCARGVSTYCAGTSSTTSYAYVGGTSLSTPLIGGCAAVLLSARPSLTPQMVRLALMMTANRASNPDNTYGWGIADLADALDWGAKIGADIKTGSVPLTINFIDSSYVPVAGWTWSFGDSDSSLQQNPVHVYDEVGVYDVTLRIISDGRPLTATMPKYIIALADTLTFTSDTVYAGRAAVIDVNLTNSQPLQVFTIPFDFSVGMNMTLDSFTTAGTRAAGFATVRVAGTPSDEQQAIYFSGTSPIPAGSGPIMKLFFRTDPYTIGNSKAQIDTVTVSGYSLKLSASEFDYIPVAYGGEVVIRDVARGDANNDGLVNVGDAVSMINFVFKGGAEPITIESGDANSDFVANVADAVYVINFIFRGGPPPDDP